MDVEEREKKAKFLEGLLKYPGETPNTDYKAGVEFVESSEFAVKLVKHSLGLANSGGGYLIIGFKEVDSKPVPDNKLTAQIVSSYEVTRLSQFVSKHIRGSDTLKLVVWKIPYQKIDYPIIEVFSFDKKPFFCSSTKNDSHDKEIIKEGALYVRSAKTNTVELADPSNWENLIDLTVKKRNDEALSRFQSLLEELGIQKQFREEKRIKVTVAPTVIYNSKTTSNSKEVEEILTKEGFKNAYFEAVHWLPEDDKKWGQGTLLKAAEKAKLHKTGWPIGIVLHTPEGKPQPMEHGIKAVVVAKRSWPSFDYWFLEENGYYYFARNYQEDEEKESSLMFFDTRIWRIAEIIDHCISLYTELEVNPTSKIHLEISHKSLKGRSLAASNPGRLMLYERKATSNEVKWEIDTTLDDLATSRKTYIEEAARKLFILFDFFEPDQSVLDSVLSEYDKSNF